MLAKETDTPFSDDGWIYEIKWDGYRAIAEVNGKEALLYSRNGNTFNDSYPAVVNALSTLNINAVLDGEVVVVDDDGRSNFQLLQHYEEAFPLEYRVFDVLSVNEKDVCHLPLTERKALLKKLIKKNPVVKYSEHIEKTGLEFFDAAVKNDLEGIMAKKADSEYYPGVRTNNWLKIKHHKSREAIIAGFTEPTGTRKYFGALVLGIKKGSKLMYAGHTGSGFNQQSLKEMSALLKPLIQKTSPFKETVKTNMPVTWVKPVLVCEIKFTEITRDGKMRHPIFLRLRDDKQANDVSMENQETTGPKKAATKKAGKKMPVTDPGLSAAKTIDEEGMMHFGKTAVKTTNLNKIYFPGEGVTKGDVINYYISISKYILPYLKNRPQSLKRNPNGIKDHGFFHKDAGNEAPSWVKSKAIFSESANKDIDYILCNNQPTLTYLNNLGCIEINPWHSTILALDKPDYMIIDIDPSKKNTFEQVIETANVVHEVLKQTGAESYCKTSGATGLHVYVPTGKKYTYDQLKDFAHVICMVVQEQLPQFTSLERNLKKRGDKMIYLDHLQNRRGQTISSVYSLRPHPGATVSMPVTWAEVKTGLSPQQFTIHNALKRIEKTDAYFKAILGKGIDLKKCLAKLEKISG
jgi:bifunctional non-homologous end joining protein LigD